MTHAAPEAPSEPALRVSVLLCTFNAGSYLLPQLQSLAAQARPPDELVVRDDGSSDGTLEVLDRFAGEAPFPVRTIRNEQRLGPYQNFAAAAAVADGDLLMFCDQDDAWHPRKIERQAAVLQADPAAVLVACDARVCDADLVPSDRTFFSRVGLHQAMRRRLENQAGAAFEEFLRHPILSGATLCFRASLRELLLPIPSRWYHDSWTSLIAAASGPIRFIPEPLQDYRQHEKQQVGVRSVSRLQRLLRARKHRKDEMFDLYVERSRQLAERLEAAGRPELAPLARRAQETAAFWHDRWDAKRSLVRRPWLIGRNLLRGRYHTHAHGWRTVLADAIA